VTIAENDGIDTEEVGHALMLFPFIILAFHATLNSLNTKNTNGREEWGRLDILSFVKALGFGFFDVHNLLD